MAGAAVPYRPPSLWLWLLPGGGQFALGQPVAGAAYAGGAAALGGWAAHAESRRESGELNAPLLYAQQVYVLSMYSAYRDLRLRYPTEQGPPPDPAGTAALAGAAFDSRTLSSPWVWGFALAGAGINYGLARAGSNRREWSDIRRVRYLGDSFNRDIGTAVYGAYWVPVSLGAGLSEEALFRGMLQSDWEARWGPRAGLWSASAAFGLAHLTRPKDPESWAQVGFATLAGVYLGRRYQKTGYRLAEPVAAHFWFDVAAGVASYLADPEDNALGAKIQFAY